MKRPLRVLHVIDSIGPGGAEQNLLTVLPHLPPDRFENHIAWLYDDSRLLDQMAPFVASATHLRSGHGIFHVSTAVRLAWLIAERGIDVVHAQLIRTQLVARAASLLAGRVPVVTTWQNTNYAPESLSIFGHSRRDRAAILALDAISSRYDSKFLAVSEYVKSNSCEALHVDPRRVTVVPNAVAPNRYAPVPASDIAELRASLGVSTGRLILNVGRLVDQKDQRTAIDAMPSVLRRHPDVVLAVAGGGPREQSLREQIARLGLEKSVKLLGVRSDIPSLLQAADVFLFPSLFEGLPVALVEALANALPAVVSDIPPHREVAEGMASVRFVPTGQPERIASALVELLSDLPAARSSASQAAETIRHRFSASAIGAALGEAIEGAARGSMR